MYIKLFDISNEKVVPTAHCFTINYLNDIMKKYPKKYLKIFAYLQYTCSWNPDDNPYLAMREEDREASILSDLDIDFSLDDPLIQVALDRCREMFDMPSARIWRSLKIGIDKISTFIDETIPDSGKDGSMTDYMKALKEINGLYENYNKGYKAFMEDVKINIRGDKFISQV